MPEHEIQPELELFEQVGQQDNIYLSHHCLKARLALAHKGLPFVSRPWHLSQKEKPTSSLTGPVLLHKGNKMGDTWNIIQYLDAVFPNTPTLLLETPFIAFLHSWTADGAPVKLISQIVLNEMLDQMTEEDRACFMSSLQERMSQYGAPPGISLEEFTAGQKEHIRALQAELEPIRQVLQRHRWLGGSEPGYPDICLFALFTWAHNVSKVKLLQPTDPVSEWRGRCRQHYHWAIL